MKFVTAITVLSFAASLVSSINAFAPTTHTTTALHKSSLLQSNNIDASISTCDVCRPHRISAKATQLKQHIKDNNQTTKSNKMSEEYMPMELLPPKENWEANSTKRLSRVEMQKAIAKVKRFVERRLETDLNLFEHTAPIAFVSGTGVNDELDGSESKAPVKFVVPNQYIPRGSRVELS